MLHLEHLYEVLETLRRHKLFAKLTKCIFATDKVGYLGHIVSGAGVATDPKKIEDVLNWPILASSLNLEGFWG